MTRNVDRQSPQPSTHKRRSQAERSAESRGRLIAAAIKCLHERGYARTSTIAVAEAAGLSRGAVLHHFGAKFDLIRAVVDEAFEEDDAIYRARFAEIDDPRERLLAVPDIAWEILHRPSFLAWMEIRLASRGEPALREMLREQRVKYQARLMERVRVIGEAAGVRDFERLLGFRDLLNHAFHGMAIEAAINGKQDGFAGALAEIKVMTRAFLADSTEGAEGEGAQ